MGAAWSGKGDIEVIISPTNGRGKYAMSILRFPYIRQASVLARLCATIFGIAELASTWSSKASSKAIPRLNNSMARRMFCIFGKSGLSFGDLLPHNRTIEEALTVIHGQKWKCQLENDSSVSEGRSFEANRFQKASHMAKVKALACCLLGPTCHMPPQAMWLGVRLSFGL